MLGPLGGQRRHNEMVGNTDTHTICDQGFSNAVEPTTTTYEEREELNREEANGKRLL